MNRKLRKSWIAALRSGRYKQGTGVLCRKRSDGMHYCCLGVLANLIDKKAWGPRLGDNTLNWKDPVDHMSRNGGINGAHIGDSKSRTADEIQSTLVMMNDGDRASFAKIADWIRDNIPSTD